MFLSVVIPTRNRSTLLHNALQSLTLQACPEDLFEIIVIDNGSTDRTSDVCESFAYKFNNFRYFYDERPGLHIGRHLGLKNANGDILVYSDDDIVATPTWLEGISESFNDTNVVLVGGKNIPLFESEPPLWLNSLWRENSYGRAIGFYSVLDFGEECKKIPACYVWGCNFSIRKEYLKQMGGFHPDGMPESRLLYRGDGESHVTTHIESEGRKVIYNPKASVYHVVSQKRMTFEYIFNRAYAQGISDSYSQVRKNGVRLTELFYCKYYKRIKEYINLYRKKFGSDELMIQKNIHNGYWAGFLAHQREVAGNKELYDWVVKTNYLED